MTDRVDKTVRSKIMSSVRQKGTGPETEIRRMLHRAGYRYRLHRRDLPGSPDIVFPARRKVVFVHGCFWHGHDCRWGRLPKSNLDYWVPKIDANRARDRRNCEALEAAGWEVAIVWQCELRDPQAAFDKLCTFLDAPSACRR